MVEELDDWSGLPGPTPVEAVDAAYASATADASPELRADGRTTVALLATRFTMEQDFYAGRLRERGLDVLVPGEADRETVHRVIYDELVHDDVREESRTAYLGVIERLAERGADSVVLGCTEIGLLLGPDDGVLPQYDTTDLHVAAGVDWLCA